MLIVWFRSNDFAFYKCSISVLFNELAISINALKFPKSKEKNIQNERYVSAIIINRLCVLNETLMHKQIAETNVLCNELTAYRQYTYKIHTIHFIWCITSKPKSEHHSPLSPNDD